MYHFPGSNPLSGAYRGPDAIRDFLRRRTELLSMADEAHGHYHDFIANDEHGIQLMHLHASTGGREVEWHAVAIYHFRDGKLDHAWVHVDPQQAVDELLSSLDGGAPGTG